MSDFIGFQNEGNQTHGPFLQGAAPGVDSLPVGFISDLRLFLTARTEYPAFLSQVSYDSNNDTWFISIADPGTGTVLISGTCARKDANGLERKSASIGSGEKVAVFIPGPKWNDPSWGGSASWTKNFQPQSNKIQADREFHGPRTIRRILIDGQSDPFSGSYPFDSIQKITSGYNLQLSTNIDAIPDSISLNNDSSNTVVITAGYGLGDGPEPQSEDPYPAICTINGIKGDANGNFKMSALDCIVLSQPIDTVHNSIIPNSIQVESNCTACCGCNNYRNVASAISAKYTKLITLRDRLSDLLASSYNSYSSAIEALKPKIKNNNQ